MKQSQAWIVQVEADIEVAELLSKITNPAMRCQALAKYQQTVEKSIKAMVAAAADLGVNITISRSHTPAKEIDALRRLQGALNNVSFEYLAKTVSDKRRAEIIDLCRFAPKYPKPGQPFLVNTEYPFESVPSSGDWIAPAIASAFTPELVSSAHSLAWVLHRRAKNFVSLARRAK